ncbi:MAG: hypothetical protein A49_03610 [Methyloceanibacter sp.]|nr:MAG: hypothetical protein A49_03610 [Methyloceanibacter sp.]
MNPALGLLLFAAFVVFIWLTQGLYMALLWVDLFVLGVLVTTLVLLSWHMACYKPNRLGGWERTMRFNKRKNRIEIGHRLTDGEVDRILGDQQ